MKSAKDIKELAINTITLEAKSIENIKNFIDDAFVQTINIIMQTRGRVIVSGIGKSAIIAHKIASSLNSTGTLSQFLHASDALHGDMGMINNNDCIICLSQSGETDELKILLQLVKKIGIKIVSITGNTNSTIARMSDVVLSSKIEREACPNNLAPTASSTVQLVIGDAIVVALMECKGFSSVDFSKFHPGGILGKKLSMRVLDLYKRNKKPLVNIEADIKTIIYEISSNCLGVTAVEDNGELTGIITDGDLRRMMEKYKNIYEIKAKDIMTQKPKTIHEKVLLTEALNIMKENSITQLLVVDDSNEYVGVIHIHDIIKEGIV